MTKDTHTHTGVLGGRYEEITDSAAQRAKGRMNENRGTWRSQEV